MELGLDGPHGHSQEAGDLFVLVAFDVVQDEDGAGAVGQPGDGALQGQVRLGHGALRLSQVGREVLVALLPAAVGAHLPQDDPGGQAVEPGAERALAAEGGERSPGRDERLLGHLLGETGIAGHAQGEGMDPPVVEPVELLERARVPPARAGREHLAWVRWGEGSGGTHEVSSSVLA